MLSSFLHTSCVASVAPARAFEPVRRNASFFLLPGSRTTSSSESTLRSTTCVRHCAVRYMNAVSEQVHARWSQSRTHYDKAAISVRYTLPHTLNQIREVRIDGVAAGVERGLARLDCGCARGGQALGTNSPCMTMPLAFPVLKRSKQKWFLHSASLFESS